MLLAPFIFLRNFCFFAFLQSYNPTNMVFPLARSGFFVTFATLNL